MQDNTQQQLNYYGDSTMMELQKLLFYSIERLYGANIIIAEDIQLENPKEIKNGDVSSNIAMKLSKIIKKSPLEIASELVGDLDKFPIIKKVEAVNPGFINFHIIDNYFKNKINLVIEKKEDFGKTNWGNNKTWLIEHTSANPNKAMHFAHLRNTVTAMAISNLWESIGIKVIRDYIDNDRGIAIAKLMWGYLKFGRKDEKQITDMDYWYIHQDEWLTPEYLNEKPDHFIDKLYVKASDDFKDIEVEKKVRQLVVDWESENKIVWELWRLVMTYSHEGIQQTLKRLGTKIDKTWHEHLIYKLGKQYVEEGLSKGIFIKLEDGAVLTNLKKYKIPDTIIIKRDGTSLYLTQDLALTKLKRDTFNPDKLFWVVGPDQNLALKQVFAVCDQMGFGKFEDYSHLVFGYITVKGQGKMSSRKGNVVYIDDLLDDARDLIKEKINNKNLTQEEKNDVSEKTGLAAVKYSILKVGRLTDTAFDFETSLSFEGDSGPYLMYSYARAKSILRESDIKISELEEVENVFQSIYELNLLKWISKFPQIIQEAGLSYSPNLLCSFLYELAQKFNQFYTNCPVLNAENDLNKAARIRIVWSTAQVLKNGLKILGIDTVEKM